MNDAIYQVLEGQGMVRIPVVTHIGRNVEDLLLGRLMDRR